MRISHVFTILVIISSSTHGLAQDGVNVRVGPDIGVDTRGDGVRIQVGPLRIRVGGNSVRRSAIVPDRAPQRAREVSRFLSDRTLVEAPVFSKQFRSLGQVKDIVIDTGSGQVRYAVISYPDIDAGRKLFAVPLNVLELEWQPQGLMWRTNFEGVTLAEAPQFDTEQWPETADRHWADEIDLYYGAGSHEGQLVEDFESDPQPLKDQLPLQRISHLIGLPLLDNSTNTLGTVGRLILDRDTGQIRYVAIQEHEQPGDISNPNAILVPIEVLDCVPVEDTVQLTILLSADQVMNAPRIQLARALQPGHEDWTAGIDAYFQMTSARSTDRVVAE